MRYNFSPQVKENNEYVVIYDDDPTFITWKIEGRVLSYGVGWRNICRAAGIVDPMQSASMSSDRVVVGTRLRMGQVITT